MISADQTRARSNARELLLQALYQWQLAGHSVGELVEQFSQRDEYATADGEYFESLLREIEQRHGDFDALIERYADRSPDQLDPLGRAALLMGMAELSRRTVPRKVAINEAVELAKRYGPTDVYRFVNAVLDRASSDLQTDTTGSDRDP